MSSKKTTTAPTSIAIAPVENAIVPVDDGVMAIAADHTSKKLITDEEAMEFLGMGVNEAVQRAQDSIPSSGINLLRGTRDFNLGTVRMPGTLNNPPRYLDGFTNTGGYTFYKDNDGFTVATATRASGEAIKIIDDYVDYPKLGSIHTFSFECMVENSSVIPSTLGIIYVIKKSDNAMLYQRTVGNQYALQKIENGKWVKFVCSTTIPSTITDDCFLIARLNFSDGDGTVHYKKAILNEGEVANPTWAANPFDVSEVRNPMTLDRIEAVSVTGKISLSDEQFKNPGRWAFSSSSLSNITDLPDLPGTGYINLITMRTWNDNASMQIVIQPSTGCFCTRAIDATWNTVTQWKYHYAS